MTAVTRRLASALLALVALLTVACPERTPVDAPPYEQPAVSAALLAALEQAQNFHHRADVLLNEGKTREAIAEVEQVLAVKFPAGAVEAEDVRLDARARLGLLWLAAGDVDAAERVVQAGLDQATRDSFFQANLWHVRGRVHEARAAQLPAADAKPELLRAIDAYARGQDINVRVQGRLFEEAKQEVSR